MTEEPIGDYEFFGPSEWKIEIIGLIDRFLDSLKEKSQSLSDSFNENSQLLIERARNVLANLVNRI